MALFHIDSRRVIGGPDALGEQIAVAARTDTAASSARDTP